MFGMHALETASLGRPWNTAQTAVLTEFPEGDAIYTLTWADGATVTLECETHAKARADLAALGFVS